MSPKKTRSETRNEDVARLTTLITRLRAPGGCPWDREQTRDSVRAYVIEEAHEVAAAIDGGDWQELAGELGDLLFQIVFLSRLASEIDAFDLQDVIERVETKMIDRHPHVFGDEEIGNADDVRKTWEQRKLDRDGGDRSLLAGVALSVPSLQAAYRMTAKASDVGFDWNDWREVLEKVEEEMGEVRQAQETQPLDASAVSEEIGDLLFTIANLSRHLEVDPEAALARANLKFRRRFEAVEQKIREAGGRLADTARPELERLWAEVKSEECAGD